MLLLRSYIRIVFLWTYCVPHDDKDVIREGTIDVLRGVQVEEVTVMVVQVDTCIVQIHNNLYLLHYQPYL